jgi:hypothetical protein
MPFGNLITARSIASASRRTPAVVSGNNPRGQLIEDLRGPFPNRPEKTHQPIRSRSRVLFELTLPYREDAPASRFQFCLRVSVTFPIPCQLRFPILAPCPWQPPFAATGVLMPKTAMEENNFPPAGENEVRLARQILSMQPEPVTETVQQTPQSEFR